MRRDDTLPEGLLAVADEVTESEAVEPETLRLHAVEPEAFEPAARMGVLLVAGSDQEPGARLLELREGRSVLGAGAGASLRVQGAGVADEHLALEASRTGVTATALAPSERNGKAWTNATLASGDVLRIGDLHLQYVAAGGAALVRPPVAEVGRLWWAASGWAFGYLAVLVLTLGFGGSAAAGDRAEPAFVDLREDRTIAVVGAAGYDAPGAPSSGAPHAAAPAHDSLDEVAEARPARLDGGLPLPANEGAEAGAAAIAAAYSGGPVTTSAAPEERSNERPRASAPGGAVASITPPQKSAVEQAPARRVPAPRKAAPKRGASTHRRPSSSRLDVEQLARMWAAWDAGAVEEVAELGAGSSDLEAHRLAILARRFALALERSRAARGVAAVPALEEALGIAEEIGRDGPAVRDIRGALGALHRSAARRAERSGDDVGAVYHCEQALAIRPADAEARAMRQSLGARARPIYLEGYALQHLDPPAALRLFDQARLLALPEDPDGRKAAALAAKLRAEGRVRAGNDRL